jgi:hypothetical protein
LVGVSGGAVIVNVISATGKGVGSSIGKGGVGPVTSEVGSEKAEQELQSMKMMIKISRGYL